MLKQRDFEVITTITEGVREWAEEYADANPDHCYDDLCGLCAIASTKLCYELRENGYDAIIGVSSLGWFTYHAFVIVDDHIVDITATQFDLPSVVIKPIKEAEKEPHWRLYKAFATPGGLIKFLRSIDWCPEQMPSEDLMKGD